MAGQPVTGMTLLGKGMTSLGRLRERIEIVPGFKPRPGVSHIVFDFDGTLSWLRHGWPRLMVETFRDYVPTGPGETRQDLDALLLRDVLALNGQPAICQMECGARRAAERGAPGLNPQDLFQDYAGRLGAVVHARTENLRRGQASPDEFLVRGTRRFLELLAGRGLTLIILSGTVEPQVQEEAELLGLTPYFGRHVYGSTPKLAESSKAAVIGRLLREEQIAGEHLLSFGDGPVEIAATRAAGGLAVGVASDEDDPNSGRLHPAKLELMRAAGAQVFVPDYEEPEALLDLLLGAGGDRRGCQPGDSSDRPDKSARSDQSAKK
jgi:phosphoglycolate phosphatase-like HAD superfamily hydrolase